MSGEAPRVLVVDDDTMNRDLMVRRLKKKGYEAVDAESGPLALDWLQGNGTDLVLLDVEMPGMSGFEVLRALREKYTPAQLPIIMVTGKSDSEDIVQALAAGANDYVTKPVDFAVALARIQTQLSRKRAEEALRESEERYALAARGANDGLWDWDLIRGKIYFSPRWKAMLGWSEDEIGDDPDEWFRRIHPDDVERVRADINAHLQNQTPHYEDEYRILHRDGNYLWMLGRGIAVRNGHGQATRIAGSQTDITRGKVIDELTGLPNRVLFMDRLVRSFERARRQQDKTVALIFLDLDGFKLINDSFGHMVGDQLLVAVANRLEATVRSSDCVARYGRSHTIARLGGDEFTILLEDISGQEDATRIAERIAGELSTPFALCGHQLFPTASMGIALYNASYQSPEELLRDADTAMYSAKALGKKRYEVFDSSMRAQAISRLQLESELRLALERDELEVHYQALVSLETERIKGFEALMRWNHPTRGLVPPSEFIPVAEETGLIVPMGRWILETACQQLRLWLERFGDKLPLSMSVNLSAQHFLQPQLLDQCRDIMREMELPEGSLILEVTESLMMANPDMAVEFMRKLKSLGIKIALDDFGTGYSSLSYLHRFPLDCLKIDRFFVSRIMEDDEIIRTIITLGRNLGLMLVAEGVEKSEQAAKLRALQCGYAQGYYYGVPTGALEATDLLAAKYRRIAEPPTAGACDMDDVVTPIAEGLLQKSGGCAAPLSAKI